MNLLTLKAEFQAIQRGTARKIFPQTKEEIARKIKYGSCLAGSGS